LDPSRKHVLSKTGAYQSILEAILIDMLCDIARADDVETKALTFDLSSINESLQLAAVAFQEYMRWENHVSYLI
jgi:predicted DNA-binding ribbon-helix-helix protein